MGDGCRSFAGSVTKIDCDIDCDRCNGVTFKYGFDVGEEADVTGSMASPDAFSDTIRGHQRLETFKYESRLQRLPKRTQIRSQSAHCPDKKAGSAMGWPKSINRTEAFWVRPMSDTRKVCCEANYK